MEYLYTIFVTYFLLCWSQVVPVGAIPQYYNSAQDTCVLSLVIPKDSIKNNCNNHEALLAKIQSLEAQLRQMTHHVRVIDTQRIQPAMTQYADLANKVRNMESQMSAMTLKNRYLESKYHEFESKLESVSRSSSRSSEGSDRLLDPIKPLLMEEFQILKANLMQSLEQELFHLYSQNLEEIGSATGMEELSESSSLQKLLLKGDNSLLRTKDQEIDELLEVDSVNINQLARSLQKLTGRINMGNEEERTHEIALEKELGDSEVNVTSTNHSNLTADTNTSSVSDDEQQRNVSDGTDQTESVLQYNISTENTLSENESLSDSLSSNSSSVFPNRSQSSLTAKEKDQVTNEISQQLQVIIQRIVKKAVQQQQEEVAIATVPQDTETTQCNVTEKLSELEMKFSELKKNLTEFYRTERTSSLSAGLLMTQQVADLKAGLESLSRRVDGPQNTLQRASHLQNELDILKTHIQVNLKERLDTSVTALEQRVTILERNNNMSSSYLNIFKQTLQSYRNESQNMIGNLQQDINAVQSQIRHLNKSRNQNSDVEMRVNDLEADFGDFDFKQNAFDVKLDRIKDSMAQNDREVGTKFRSIQQNLHRVQSRFTMLTNMSRNIQIMGVKQSTMEKKVSKNEITLKYLYIQHRLESGEWMAYNFSYNSVKNSCNKLQYVRQNSVCSGTTARFVGVILCSEDKYKILLGNSLDDEFLDIADERGHGEDHCEFVGGSREKQALVEKEFSFFPSTRAYMRADWGQEPHLANMSPILTPVASWYECGVKIP
ncbi:putative leucine-rich repeat-containing protein DDB_G0290503 [Pecten maximus]|uniref:putative leucine-rich repeat-containing protein DDB_G0290503 n=1 Tax=Pecten maximus TaxID=6579 RepID=UPI001458BBF2|nr:putative leucine-rich repeat-containing protein DDB_G0290503 [Pecten maximus]